MKHLKEWLEYRGISPYRLIQMTGIQPIRVYAYVNNTQRRPPHPKTVRRIAYALECDAEDLDEAPPKKEAI